MSENKGRAALTERRRNVSEHDCASYSTQLLQLIVCSSCSEGVEKDGDTAWSTKKGLESELEKLQA